MQRNAIISFVFAALAISAVFSAQAAAQTPPGQPAAIGQPAPTHVGPPSLYPNPTLTPGVAATLNVSELTAVYSHPCPAHKPTCTYSQSHRNVPPEEHTQVYNAYNVPPAARNIQSGEVDHFYPLCAGGSNDLHNLWYQPAANQWNGRNFGFHEKDDLEAWICVQIKAGQLDPREAFQKITADWVRYYLEAQPPHQNFSE
jgi:hypothetical protein